MKGFDSKKARSTNVKVIQTCIILICTVQTDHFINYDNLRSISPWYLNSIKAKQNARKSFTFADHRMSNNITSYSHHIANLIEFKWEWKIVYVIIKKPRCSFTFCILCYDNLNALFFFLIIHMTIFLKLILLGTVSNERKRKKNSLIAMKILEMRTRKFSQTKEKFSISFFARKKAILMSYG